jgi:hypothetical protein
MLPVMREGNLCVVLATCKEWRPAAAGPHAFSLPGRNPIAELEYSQNGN